MLTTLNVLGLDQGRIFSEAEMGRHLGLTEPSPEEGVPPAPPRRGFWRRLLALRGALVAVRLPHRAGPASLS
jgi:hypothetical protein